MEGQPQNNQKKTPELVELYALLSAEATAADHPVHDYFVRRYQWVVNHLQESLQQVAAAGELREGVDPVSAARSMVALMDGLQIQWLYDRNSVDMAAEAHLRAVPVDRRAVARGCSAAAGRRRQRLRRRPRRPRVARAPGVSPAVDLRLGIGSDLRPGDPSGTTAAAAAELAREILELAGRDYVPVLVGSNVGFADRTTPIASPAALALVVQAMRDDVDTALRRHRAPRLRGCWADRDRHARSRGSQWRS